jgi:hypothetical protein
LEIEVFFFFFTGIVNDGRELRYRKKKVDFEGVLGKLKMPSG